MSCIDVLCHQLRHRKLCGLLEICIPENIVSNSHALDAEGVTAGSKLDIGMADKMVTLALSALGQLGQAISGCWLQMRGVQSA